MKQLLLGLALSGALLGAACSSGEADENSSNDAATDSNDETSGESSPTDTDSAGDTDTVTVGSLGSCEERAALFATKGSVNENLADPEVSATCDEDTISVSANGIPDYTYIQTSPGDPNVQNLAFDIPADPTVASESSDIARLGPVAIALNGVPIYGPTEGTGGDVLSLEGALSECGSHNGPTGFHLHLLGTSTTTDCIFTPAEVEAEPQLLGFAFDGYPIYSGNSQYTSSWELTDESLFASDTWSAHSYVEGSGDLDECNGLTDTEGNYAYYTTDAFPYVIGCYSGAVDAALSEGAGGGPGGGPGGDGQGPPPGDGPPQ